MSIVYMPEKTPIGDEMVETELDFLDPFDSIRQGKIMATLTRDTCDVELVEKMILAGLNVVRFKCSYDSHENMQEMKAIINEAVQNANNAMKYNACVAVGLDIAGKQIKTGYLSSSNELDLRKNDTVRFTSNPEFAFHSNRENMFLDEPNIMKIMKPGTKVLIDDGRIILVVSAIGTETVICSVEKPGRLGSRREVQILGVDVNIRGITVKDREDLKFAVQQQMDAVFVSRARTASQIQEIRRFMGRRGKNIRIIAKISNSQAIRNISQLIKAADGVLITRRRLRKELSQAEVVMAVKMICAQCNAGHCPVYVGTRILHSIMTKNKHSINDVMDLYNLISDGADGVMLTAQTVFARKPVETIATLNSILEQIEGNNKFFHGIDEIMALNKTKKFNAKHAMAASIAKCVNFSGAKVVIIMTNSGKMACLVSLYRPKCPIIAISRYSKTLQLTHFHRGCIPVIYKAKRKKTWQAEKNKCFKYALEVARSLGIVKFNDPVVTVSHFDELDTFPSCVGVISANFCEEQPMEEQSDEQSEEEQQQPEEEPSEEEQSTEEESTEEESTEEQSHESSSSSSSKPSEDS